MMSWNRATGCAITQVALVFRFRQTRYAPTQALAETLGKDKGTVAGDQLQKVAGSVYDGGTMRAPLQVVLDAGAQLRRQVVLQIVGHLAPDLLAADIQQPMLPSSRPV